MASYYSGLDGLGRILLIATLTLTAISLMLFTIGQPERGYSGYFLIAGGILAIAEVSHRRGLDRARSPKDPQ